MKKENILVVPRAILEPFINFRGFKSSGDAPINEWLEQGVFKSREEMESDPSYKQLIPYILLRHEERVFRYWRTKRAGESRLHHLYSLGVGGHIDQCDENLFTQTNELLDEAAMRELKEEVEIDSPESLKHIGFINDDESDVGKVHFGIVYEAWLDNETIKTREGALGRGEWKPITELNDVEYETWSQFLVDEYLTK
jgi:predicted NUDIX family phosphoesterase